MEQNRAEPERIGAAFMSKRAALLEPAIEIAQNVIVKVLKMPSVLVSAQHLRAHERVHRLGLLLVMRQKVDIEIERKDFAQNGSRLWRDGWGESAARVAR